MTIYPFLQHILLKISRLFTTVTHADYLKDDIQDHSHDNQSFGIISTIFFPFSPSPFYNSKSSSQRLERVSKGHKLWNILDEIECEHNYEGKTSPDMTRVKRNMVSQLHDVGSSYFPKEPLHGLNVDLKVVFLGRIIIIC